MYLPSSVWSRLGSVRRQLTSALSRNRQQPLIRAAAASVEMLEQRTLLSLTVSPTVSASSVSEGTTVTLSFAAAMSSDSTLDSGFWVNWGDNTGDQYYSTTWLDSNGYGPYDSPQGPGSFTAQAQPTHAYAEPSSRNGYNLAAWANETNSDSTTDQACVILQEHVSEATPNPQVNGNSSVDQGSTYTISPALDDPGGDSPSQWQINWGDGSPTETDAPAASYPHIYNSAGTFTITATATSEDGQSQASQTVSVAGPAPSDPSNLTAVASGSKVNLNWTASTGAVTAYHVQRSPDGSASTYADIGTTAATTTSYTDSTGAANTEYWYRVYAVNGITPSPGYSNAPWVTLPPAAPTGLASAATSTSVLLSWNSVSGASTYTVQRKGPNDSSYTSLPGSPTYYNSFSDSNVSAGTAIRTKLLRMAPAAPPTQRR